MSGVLVDTSVFIEYLRGESDDALAVLILQNEVLLSPVVRLELLAGVAKGQLKELKRLLSALRTIEAFAAPDECQALLEAARGSGLFGGIPDLLILADAKRHHAPLFTYDKKMKALAQKFRIATVEG